MPALGFSFPHNCVFIRKKLKCKKFFKKTKTLIEEGKGWPHHSHTAMDLRPALSSPPMLSHQLGFGELFFFYKTSFCINLAFNSKLFLFLFFTMYSVSDPVACHSSSSGSRAVRNGESLYPLLFLGMVLSLGPSSHLPSRHVGTGFCSRYLCTGYAALAHWHCRPEDRITISPLLHWELSPAAPTLKVGTSSHSRLIYSS